MASKRRRSRRPIPGLKRSPDSRRPKRLFTLFCEGRNTEPAYFEALRRSCADTLVEVDSHGGIGVPMTIAERAVEFARERGLHPRSRKKKDSYERDDEVWAVFDRDEHPKFNDAVALCEGGGVGVGCSSPCFELWLILHEQEFDQLRNRHEVQRKLQQLRPEYDRSGQKVPDCDDLVKRVADAERRAKAQLKLREEEGIPNQSPSTRVGLLTAAIRQQDSSSN